MQRQVLVEYLNNFLEVTRFRDYAPNGLQVEGKNTIKNILCGVSASQELIDEAVRCHADAVLVHHGWFWKGEDPCICAMKKRRLTTVLTNNVNLIAYHLPLDAHPTVGNNAQLAKLFGFQTEKTVGELALTHVGNILDGPMPVTALKSRLANVLQREPLLVGPDNIEVKRVGWCSGGAQDEILVAAEAGCDAFISGEISERTTYIAREMGIAYFSCGHHATERYGVQALAEHLMRVFPELNAHYFEVDNPV